MNQIINYTAPHVNSNYRNLSSFNTYRDKFSKTVLRIVNSEILQNNYTFKVNHQINCEINVNLESKKKPDTLTSGSNLQPDSHIRRKMNKGIIQSNSQTNKPILKNNQKKLHSADIACLKVIRFYSLLAKNKKCHLKKGQWSDELIKFGGKAICYRALKAKRAKLEQLEYVASFRESENRNKEKVYYITQKGIDALAKWESYPQGGKSKCKKLPLEMQKTAPPLNSLKIVKNNDHMDFSKTEKKMEEEREKPQKDISPTYKLLRTLGIYEPVAKKIVAKHEDREIINALNQANRRKATSKGAYVYASLRNMLEKSQREMRDYGLEEKSRREKEQMYAWLKPKPKSSGHIMSFI